MSKYIKVVDGNPIGYSIGQLKKENPNVSFPKWPSEDQLKDYNVYKVKLIEQPKVEISQKVTEGNPVFIDGEWVQNWIVEDLKDEDVAEIKQQIFEKNEEEKRLAYQNLSDPIFFKWQRGEATKNECLTVVSQIKDWYSTNDKN